MQAEQARVLIDVDGSGAIGCPDRDVVDVVRELVDSAVQVGDASVDVDVGCGGGWAGVGTVGQGVGVTWLGSD